MCTGGNIDVDGLKRVFWNFLALFEMYKEHGIAFACFFGAVIYH